MPAMKAKLHIQQVVWVLVIACTAFSIGRAQSVQSGAESQAGAPATVTKLVETLEHDWSGSVERDPQGNVITLKITWRWCNDQTLALVAGLHELRELSLQGGGSKNKISRGGIRLLRQNTNLSSLSLGCYFTNLPAGIVPEIATLPHITEVRLAGVDLAEADYMVLATMTNLTAFQVYFGLSFGDDTLALFTNAPSLKNLVVQSRSLTSNSIALLPGFRSLTNLELQGSTWKTNWHSVPDSAERRREQRTPFAPIGAPP